MTITFNKETLRDKIYACWLGKNIAGTLGAPFEGDREINHVTGFTTAPGEPLVNDDLDLQLVWLKAMEDLGPLAVNERVLGEYWLTYIMPFWNEYGVCKSNLREGFPPPMSGEVNNDGWKHSNGAWIRTEIWACLFPGQPEKAIRYAYYDACVDHGYGEGTYAAIFVEAMQSAAFILKDINQLIDIGLSKIPENCRVARSVNIVRKAFREGLDWETARNLVVEDSSDLGWFQAPANIAFVVLGLLYGGCDFKESVLTAIHCGDDTDCTAATCGALLGIMYGTDGIPADWREYLGDKIVSGCVLYGSNPYPKTCTQLTDDVMDLLNVTTHENSFARCGSKFGSYSNIRVDIGDEDDFSQLDVSSYMGQEFAQSIGRRKQYSFTADNFMAEALIELDSKPYIKPGQTITGQITLRNKTEAFNLPEQKHYSIRFLPENGFTVTGDLNLHLSSLIDQAKGCATGTFAITAPETVQSHNRIVVEISSTGRFTPIYTQILLMG